MKESGIPKLRSETAAESRFGQMALVMMASGKMESHLGMADSCMPRVMSTKEHGEMTKQMVLDIIVTTMEVVMKDNG